MQDTFTHTRHDEAMKQEIAGKIVSALKAHGAHDDLVGIIASYGVASDRDVSDMLSTFNVEGRLFYVAG